METSEFYTGLLNSMGYMKGFAYKLTQDEDDSSDLLQDTMLKALRYRERFATGTNLKAWLYTIMKNIFINNYRRAMKSNIFIDHTDNQHFINSSTRTSKNSGEGNLALNDIRHEINALPENLRNTFMMNYTGYKYEEIAKKLNLPLGTVKVRIHHAREKLKEKLKVYGEDFQYSLS